LELHKIIYERKKLSRQTVAPPLCTHTSVKDSFAPLNAVLIPETLYSIIHAKYITFQLTNCLTLEISVKHGAPWQVTSRHGEEFLT